jgi:hypothetical protein
MIVRALPVFLLLIAPLVSQDSRALTGPRYADPARVRVDGAWHSSPTWQASEPHLDCSFTYRQALLREARLRADLISLDSYAVRELPRGSFRIEHDFDVLRSYSARPSPGGRLRTTNDLNPTES